MIWSPVRNLGMATLEQSDLVFRRFIRPLGPFGLVKHEVKPRLLSYVISHAEPDTTLPTSIHMVEGTKAHTCWLLLLLLIFFPLLFVWAIISSFQKLGVCRLCVNWACVGTKMLSNKSFFFMHFLSLDLIVVFQCSNTAQETLSKQRYVCHMWLFHMLLLEKHYLLQ